MIFEKEKNINNDMSMDIEQEQKDFSLSNSIKLSSNNFSFSEGPDKNKPVNNIDDQKQKEKEDSIKKVLINYQQGHYKQYSNNSPNIEDKEKTNSNSAIKILREGNYAQSYPRLVKQNNNININLSIFKKDNKNNYLQLSKEKKVQTKTYKKDGNMINNSNSSDDNELDLNISLSNIEVTKSNFIHDFSNFLNKMDIKIVNYFPVSLKEKNKHYFQQANFWLLIMNYLFFQENIISLYTIISLLEQCILWCTDLNLENFNSIKERIKEYISSNYSSEILSQFLFMNQLKNIDEIFEKYEKKLESKNINLIEMKISDINISENAEMKCNCELCTDDDACIRKVSEINKRKINEIKNENITYNSEIEQISQSIQTLNNISNNQELFYKGKSKKNKAIFSKSKKRR